MIQTHIFVNRDNILTEASLQSLLLDESKQLCSVKCLFLYFAYISQNKQLLAFTLFKNAC